MLQFSYRFLVCFFINLSTFKPDTENNASRAGTDCEVFDIFYSPNYVE